MVVHSKLNTNRTTGPDVGVISVSTRYVVWLDGKYDPGTGNEKLYPIRSSDHVLSRVKLFKIASDGDVENVPICKPVLRSNTLVVIALTFDDVGYVPPASSTRASNVAAVNAMIRP